MLTALNQNKMFQGMAQAKKMIQTLKSVGNPQMMFNQMMGQNPQLKQIMDYVNANGGDPKSAFYKMAEERGIDPESILSQLR